MSSPPTGANGMLKHDQFRSGIPKNIMDLCNRTHHFKPEANNVTINPDTMPPKGFLRSLSIDKKERRNSLEHVHPYPSANRAPPSPPPVKSVSGTTPPLNSFYMPPSGMEGAPPATFDHTQKTLFKSFDFKS